MIRPILDFAHCPLPRLVHFGGDRQGYKRAYENKRTGAIRPAAATGREPIVSGPGPGEHGSNRTGAVHGDRRVPCMLNAPAGLATQRHRFRDEGLRLAGVWTHRRRAVSRRNKPTPTELATSCLIKTTSTVYAT